MELHDKGRSMLKKNTATDHKMQYLGLTLLFSWHYCLWFFPRSFNGIYFLDDRVVFSWLIALVTAVVTLAIVPLVLGRQHHLCEKQVFLWVSSGVGCLGTACLTLFSMALSSPWLAYSCSAAIGIAAGLLWIQCGEILIRAQASFAPRDILPIYGGFLLLSILVAHLMPKDLSSIFVSLLPLGASLLIFRSMKITKALSYPLLLPREVSRNGVKAILIVGIVSTVVALTTFYTAAILQLVDFQLSEWAYSWGIAAGALFILLIWAIIRLLPPNKHIFRLFPWILVLSVVACVLYLIDSRINAIAFLLAVAISSVLEVLLIMYTGILPLRGFATPAAAFGISGGSIRLGICLGNALALFYERTPELPDSIIRITIRVLIVILMGLCIVLVRQEYRINELIRSPETISEQEALYEQIATEYRLSGREKEIVAFLARGYTASAISEKLIISTTTVNTHIHHIYEKMGVHKRSELINYMNRRN